MGFRSGKGNPYALLKAENARLQAQIEELRLRPQMLEFASKLGESILILLVTRPYEQWPDLCRTAFIHMQERVPTLAYLYKERLPK